MEIDKSGNQVTDSSSNYGNLRHVPVRSKAQISLSKILHIITSTKSLDPQLEARRDSCFDLDLNLRLAPPSVEDEEFVFKQKKGGLSACSFIGEGGGVVVDCDSSAACGGCGGGGEEKSSEGECDPKEIENLKEDDTNKTRELSEITNVHSRSLEVTESATEITKFNDDRKYRSSLELLVEAARLISGDFADDNDVVIGEDKGEDEESRKRKSEEEKMESENGLKKLKEEGKKEETNWTAEIYEELSPVVRSKRGRNQVLPYRYRDSVIEPLKPMTRQRSNPVSSKRLSR